MTQVIGHRGAPQVAPENSLASFHAARARSGPTESSSTCAARRTAALAVHHDAHLRGRPADRRRWSGRAARRDARPRPPRSTPAPASASSTSRSRTGPTTSTSTPTLALVDRVVEVLAGPADDERGRVLVSASTCPRSTGCGSWRPTWPPPGSSSVRASTGGRPRGSTRSPPWWPRSWTTGTGRSTPTTPSSRPSWWSRPRSAAWPSTPGPATTPTASAGSPTSASTPSSPTSPTSPSPPSAARRRRRRRRRGSPTSPPARRLRRSDTAPGPRDPLWACRAGRSEARMPRGSWLQGRTRSRTSGSWRNSSTSASPRWSPSTWYGTGP